MPTDDEPLWRGTSPEDRAALRRKQLIEACKQIVGAEGAGALGVRAVCRLANVSPRKFYESFPDIDALLVATYDVAVRDLLGAVTAAVPAGSRTKDSRDVRARIHAVFDAATLFLEQDPAAGRIIFREALHSDVLREHAMATLPLFLETTRHAVIRTGRRKSAPTQGQLEATLLSGALSSLLGEWTSGATPWTRADVVAYCTAATHAIMSITL